MRPQAGFTLLEVLVALAVLAIAMGAIISAATQSINTVATLRDQTFAGWVALNQINQRLLDPKPWPDEGSSSGSAELAGRAWRWEAQFSKTGDPDLRRLDLTVRARENGPELSRRVAFKGKPPEKAPADPASPAGQSPTPKEKSPSPNKPPSSP
ncbi:MAG: type II secretion system minor pseudopilin GspI [Candidatus Competibacter sp.]|nr:type II secretion system minor pseudopilin GspI [Candidatus Competibacter sp.]MDG4606083.1 type II secretion system minor pseudopilin GspI [Candidatus Contendobacter sp.]HRD49716.1 type II secretion system minor pseudopilin GspI [Candidatus Contendobacter sp.]